MVPVLERNWLVKKNYFAASWITLALEAEKILIIASKTGKPQYLFTG